MFCILKIYIFILFLISDDYEVNKYGEAFAPVCNLRFKKVHLEDKNEKTGLTEEVRGLLLDNSNYKHLDIIPPVLSKSKKIIKFNTNETNEVSNNSNNMSIYNNEHYLVLSGVTASRSHNNIQDETKEVMDIIDGKIF